VEVQRSHNASFEALTKAMRERLASLLPMGTAGCHRCEKCTYPDAPCRFPDEISPPMEACGLMVSQICKDNQVPYYYGKDGISFTSCYLFNL
jgi:predicted metal-binding protein